MLLATSSLSAIVKTELLALVDKIHHVCEFQWIIVEGDNNYSFSAMIGVNCWVATQRILVKAGFVKYNAQYQKTPSLQKSS